MDAYSKVYKIDGDPESLARGRFSKRTGKVFDSQKQLKLILGITLSNQHSGAKMFSGPLIVEFRFFFQPSASWSAKKKKQAIGKWMIFKPDSTNLIKLIEDVGTQAGLYKDDCLICCGFFQKTYDDQARTEITITEIPDNIAGYSLIPIYK